jgi:hypothetical protein
VTEEEDAMSATSAGSQLYAQLAGLLAPPESLEDTKSLVILEPAGKDVSTLGASTALANEALADLANAIPAAAASFVDTGATYDDTWGFVLRSAAPSGPDGDPAFVTVANVLDENRTDFELMALARVDFPADVYRPVIAEPREWLDDAGWSHVSFRIGGENPDPPPSTSPAVTIPEVIPELEWRLVEPVPEPEPFPIEEVPIWVDPPIEQPIVLRSDEPERPDVSIVGRDVLAVESLPARAFAPLALRPKAADSFSRLVAGDAAELELGTRWKEVWEAARVIDVIAKVAGADPPVTAFELSFDYRVVALKRRWLRAHLCRLSGWTIPGLERHGLSNGEPVRNPGLMPLLTTRMLVVRDLVVRARWTEADRARAANAKALALGPFTVSGADAFDGSTLTRPAPQVVAWLAMVVPACPR